LGEIVLRMVLLLYRVWSAAAAAGLPVGETGG